MPDLNEDKNLSSESSSDEKDAMDKERDSSVMDATASDEVSLIDVPNETTVYRMKNVKSGAILTRNNNMKLPDGSVLSIDFVLAHNQDPEQDGLEFEISKSSKGQGVRNLLCGIIGGSKFQQFEKGKRHVQ